MKENWGEGPEEEKGRWFESGEYMKRRISLLGVREGCRSGLLELVDGVFGEFSLGMNLSNGVGSRDNDTG